MCIIVDDPLEPSEDAFDFFMKEGVNLKTGIIIGLATVITMLQVFWKYD